ncbi:hypothetical protein Tsubulata_038610, partial [Turnera subulata]
RLRELKLRFFQEKEGSLEIDCPMLGVFTLERFEVGEYDIKKFSRLVEARVSFLHKLEYYDTWLKVVKSFPRVMYLSTQNWGPQLVLSKDLSDNSLLTNLRQLELETDFSKYDMLGVASFLETSPYLERLILKPLHSTIDEGDYCEYFDLKKMKALFNKHINLSIPSLKEVELKEIKATKSEAIFLSFLVLHGVALEKIDMTLLTEGLPEGVSLPPVTIRRLLRQEKISREEAKNVKFDLVEDGIHTVYKKKNEALT